MYIPGFKAFHENSVCPPGMVCVAFAPPPGPVTACMSIEWMFLLLSLFFKRNSIVSPARTLTNGPGTVPLNVQNSYSTPSASCPYTSLVSISIITFADVVGLISGAHQGALSQRH